MLFPALFVLGFLSLTGMWLAGFSHANGAHGHGPRVHAHGGHAAHGSRLLKAPVNHGPRPSVAPLVRAGAKPSDPLLAPTSPEKEKTGLLSRLLQLLSPLTFSALLLGAGAAGTTATLLGAGVNGAYVAGALGAVAMRWLVIGPLTRAIFRFESRPAQNLEGCLMQEAAAITRFNRRGEGLIRVQIDGRDEDLLARLCEGDRARGTRVARGARVVIEEIDARRNQCVVSCADPVLPRLTGEQRD